MIESASRASSSASTVWSHRALSATLKDFLLFNHLLNEAVREYLLDCFAGWLEVILLFGAPGSF